MRQLRVWRKRLAAALEWSVVDKGLVIMLMVIPLYLQYLAWSVYVLNRPDRDHLVQIEAVKTFMTIEVWLIVIGAVIALCGLAIRKRKPDLRLFQHITIQFFGISLVLMGYTIGTMSFPSGIVLLGAPIFGFILLNRREVWLATLTSLTLLIGLSYASTYGWLPYAPVRLQATDFASNLFWMNSELFFAAPFLILISFMADQMLHWWRERENQIRKLSRTDVLTGLNNRRNILDLLDQEVSRAQRDNKPLSVVILDLDHFKRINDTWGHPTGDRVLHCVAQTLLGQVREGDHVGRYGGEEFMIVLPGTDVADAGRVTERCRAALETAEIANEGGERVHISASFGLTFHRDLAQTQAQQLIRQADEALYQAKESGRNRVETHGSNT